MPAHDHDLKIFSTCPLSAQAQPGKCVRELQEFARASEDAGYEGILVFTDNGQLDPWLVSQVIIEATDRLCPLVAIQPTYMHPYTVANLKLTPPLPANLMPGVLVSGSSEAGMSAARHLGAIAVEYPKPAAEYAAVSQTTTGAPSGIRIGIIARPEGAEAWSVAQARFPVDRKGQLTHQLAMKVSDSSWHQQLSRLGSDAPANRTPYWLVPFQNYKAVCPYLVGSYDQVAEEVGRYLDIGYRTFILDVPANREE